MRTEKHCHLSVQPRYTALHSILEHNMLHEMENGTSSMALLILEESNVLLDSLPLLETNHCDISPFPFAIEKFKYKLAFCKKHMFHIGKSKLS